MPAKWEEIAAAKRAALADSIPEEWRIPSDIKPSSEELDVSTFPHQSGWFTEEELKITDSGASALLEKLRNGELSSEAVTRAFCKRACAAQQLTNCLSETLFDSAIKRAQELDAQLKETGKTVGSLHGLPISLKDNFNIVGVDSTIGFTGYANDPATYNATLVDLLHDAGAILY
ncbi:hypothetical protein LTS18_005157, partial [Coniosporium uncinatum]